MTLAAADTRRLNALVWFGVLGGALGWAAQFVVGMQLTLARCESPSGRFAIPIEAWSVGLAAAGVLLAVLAEVTAVRVLRATRERQDELTVGRIHFLAVVAATINPLAMTIAIMAGVGVPLLSICHQS